MIILNQSIKTMQNYATWILTTLLFILKLKINIRLNSTHFLIMKIPNEKDLQQIALNHLSDIDFEGFVKVYKKCTVEPYSFFVNNTTLSSDHLLRFRKNLLK